MKIHESQFPPVELTDVTLVQYLLDCWADFKQDDLTKRTAVVDGATGQTLSYTDLKDHIFCFAGGLQARGITQQDIVAIMSPNMLEYPVAMLGTIACGAVVTPVNPLFGATELSHQLSNSDAKAIFAHALFAETALQVATELGIELVIVFGNQEEIPGTTSYQEMLAADPLAQLPGISPDAVALVAYSSGTTGLPKGVMLTHRNLVINLEQCRANMTTEYEAIIAVLPFFHVYGFQVLLNASFAMGKKLVSLPRFDLESFLQITTEHKAKRLYLVPPIVLALAKHPLVDNYDLSSLEIIFSGAAPLSKEVETMAKNRLGVHVVQGYGMTELSPVSHMCPDDFDKPGSIGKLVPNTECRIVDPASGQDVDIGEEGEIWIKGPQVMLGYLNNEEATKATIDEDGWLRTGDIGYVDQEGDYFITDRLKELIKYKGFQVPPAELEALLLTHPAVADAAVVGYPDEEAGELPKAFLVAKPDTSPTEQEIKDFVAENVVGYKKVHMVEFIDEIPKSQAGKILRRMLKENS